jgi:hypothetical protein
LYLFSILGNIFSFSTNISFFCSLKWKKLLALRSFAHEHIKFEVGPGHSIHLWHDNWHPLGPLHEKFGLRIIYDSQSTSKARVSYVIKNGEWF